jgi:Zn-finger nucleic acid-binding protein
MIKMQISEKTIASEVLKKYKNTASVFNSYNLNCPSCRGVEQDTLEKIIINNGLDPQKFMEEIREAAASDK